MLLLLKCFDIKKVNSLNDLVIIDWVLGWRTNKKKKKKKDKLASQIIGKRGYCAKGHKENLNIKLYIREV